MAANFLSLACIIVATKRTNSPARMLASWLKLKRRLKPSQREEPGKILKDG